MNYYANQTQTNPTCRGVASGEAGSNPTCSELACPELACGELVEPVEGVEPIFENSGPFLTGFTRG